MSRGVAQLVAHSNGVRAVGSSSLPAPTMKKLPKNVQRDACFLRSKGNSLRDIAKKLHIALGSAHLYTKQAHLPKSQQVELQRRGYKKGIARLSLSTMGDARRKGGFNSSHHFQIQYSKEHLLQLLHNFAIKHNRMPTKRDFYNHNRAFIRVFGSWNVAIRDAGFSPNPVLFAKKHTANDGHKCDSFAEKIIDDWLTTKKISHERSVPYLHTRFTADFKIGDTVVEFFGLHGQLKRYDYLMKKKLKIIQKYKLKVISLFPKDIFPKIQLDTLLGNLLPKPPKTAELRKGGSNFFVNLDQEKERVRREGDYPSADI